MIVMMVVMMVVVMVKPVINTIAYVRTLYVRICTHKYRHTNAVHV